MKLSKKQELLIKQFKDLLIYGYSKMQVIDLNWKKTRLKKKILYLIMGAAQSYSESILKLVTPFSHSSSVFDKAAEVLIRSLAETLININYIYSVRSEKRARIFVAHSTKDKLDFAVKYKKFMNKYPSWKLAFADKKTTSDWDNFISKKKKELKQVEKKYGQITNMPKIRNCAELADKYLNKTGKLNKKNSLESFYVNYYKFFSQMAHLTFPGLERFLNIEIMSIEIDGKPEDMERIILIAYQIYFVLLVFFMKKFDFYSISEFEKFKKISKSLLKYRFSN